MKYNLEEIKDTYHHYGSQFWAGKKCNACREKFTPENYSKKQIEITFIKKLLWIMNNSLLVFSEFSKVDEYQGSEGMKVKWYHKACLASWNETFKGLLNIKSYEPL